MPNFKCTKQNVRIAAVGSIIISMLLLIGVIISVVFANCVERSTENLNSMTLSSQSQSKQSDTTSIVVSSQEQIVPEPSFRTDAYEMGTEIPAGNYVLIDRENSNPACSVYEDASYTDETKLYTIFFQKNTFLSLKERQGVIITRAPAYPIEKADLHPDSFSDKGGAYRVDIDIPADTYTLRADNEYGTYRIYSKMSLATSNYSSISDSGYFPDIETPTITLHDGESLCLDWRHCSNS